MEEIHIILVAERLCFTALYVGHANKLIPTHGSSWNELLKVLSDFILRMLLLYQKNIHRPDLHHQKLNISFLAQGV